MRYEDTRYGSNDDYVLTRRQLPPAQIDQVQANLNQALTEQVDYPQLTADQNNYPLLSGTIHRFTSNALRTITGFANVGVGIKVILNGGSQDLVLANNSGLSVAQNQIACHTTANITLNPGESALIIYDKTSSKVRTLGFV